MSSLLPYVLIGLTTGSVYALSAMGLTLTYRTTGIFNFAHGALGAAAAYIFYDLYYQGHMSWPIATLIAVLGVGLVGGLLLERLGNVLARASVAMRIVATAGLTIGIEALIVLHYGSATINFPAFLPTKSYTVADTVINSDQLIIMGTVLVAALGLTVLLRYTPLGVSTRAVVDDPQLLTLTGASATRVRRWSWITGTTFAALSGVMGATAIGLLDPTLLTLLLVNAFGAAAIGAFKNLPLAYLGGLVVGIAAALATKWGTGEGFLAALPASLPVLVLFVVLLVLPRRHLVSRAAQQVRPAVRPRPRPMAFRIIWVALGVAILLLAPSVLGETRLPALTAVPVYAILFLSLGVLVRLSGQVSLCQLGFAAVGAAGFYHLVDGAGVPWLVALLGAGVLAVPVGAIIAIPAIRLSGLFLALATYSFGILLQQMFYDSDIMFTKEPSVSTPMPGFASTPLHYYYFVLAVAGVCCGLVWLLIRTRLGRLLQGMGESPMTLVTHGTNINITKVAVFCFSAFLAGISGALLGPITGSLNAVPFDPAFSLTLLAILVLAGGGMVRYAFVAGAAYALIPSYIRDADVLNAFNLLYGVSAVTIAVVSIRRASGRPAWLAWLRFGHDESRLGRRAAAPSPAPAVADAIAAEDVHA